MTPERALMIRILAVGGLSDPGVLSQVSGLPEDVIKSYDGPQLLACAKRSLSKHVPLKRPVRCLTCGGQRISHVPCILCTLHSRRPRYLYASN